MEAKLVDPDDKTEETNSAVAMSSVSQDDTTQDDPKTIHSRLKDSLKNIPDEGREYSEEQLKELTKKFKSKKDFEEINMKIKTDFELMTDLFKKYETIKKKQDLTRFRALFEDMEYLLHQIDNANDFVTAGGLEKLIIPNLGNQSIPELRIHSIKLLGVLVQNNPKGQIDAFEKNVGSVLLQLLAQSKSNDTNELSSIIFAFGGLLRKFPLAQEELLNNPGLNILVDLLRKQVDYKIKIKSMSLITDLIREYDEATGSGDFNKTRQYDAVDIKSRLSKTEFCSIIVELLSIHLPDYLGSLYAAEDILNVLITSKEICEPFWLESSTFRNTVLVLQSSYDRMKKQTYDGDDIELSEVIDKLEQLKRWLSKQTAVHGEL